MGHLLIAYDFVVILVGCSALAITAFWAFKTRETYLRDFCIVYVLFTALMFFSVLEKYLLLNTENWTARSWYVLSALRQVVNFAVIGGTIFFFHNLYQIRARTALISFYIAISVISIALILTPYGAVLNEVERAIRFGPAYRIASVWYMLSFTYALGIGVMFFRGIGSANKRVFVAGLLLFALVGYLESLMGFISSLQTPRVTLSAGSDFLISSIPYALYGIFLLYYFLQFITPSPAGDIAISDDLAARWGITGREREIIQKVLQGKSNADIASDLFITLATVKTHLHNIYQKIGVDSRFDLIARVRNKSQ